MLIAPWRVSVAAIVGSARRLLRSRGLCQVPPMSDDWLRRREIDSYKHRNGI